MSAYIVSNETISVVARGIVEYGINRHYFREYNSVMINDTLYAIGQELLEQNYKSVNYRYSENTPTPKFEYVNVDYDEGTLLGCISCYNYQACETEDYYESNIYKALEELKYKLLKRLIEEKGQEIRWGI